MTVQRGFQERFLEGTPTVTVKTNLRMIIEPYLIFDHPHRGIQRG